MPVDGATGSNLVYVQNVVCMSVLNFSRSSYLDNHLSESIHAWTKGWLSMHNTDPLGLCPVGGRGQKPVNLKNVVFLRLKFSSVHACGWGYGVKI